MTLAVAGSFDFDLIQAYPCVRMNATLWLARSAAATLAIGARHAEGFQTKSRIDPAVLDVRLLGEFCIPFLTPSFS